MRRLWTLVAVGVAVIAVVCAFQFLEALRNAGVWDVVTTGMILLALYWIAAGAWVRATRQVRTDASRTPPTGE